MGKSTLTVEDTSRIGARVKSLDHLVELAERKQSIAYLCGSSFYNSFYMRSPAAWALSWPARWVHQLLKRGMFIYKPVETQEEQDEQ